MGGLFVRQRPVDILEFRAIKITLSALVMTTKSSLEALVFVGGIRPPDQHNLVMVWFTLF
jgi:hypothetical protein